MTTTDINRRVGGLYCTEVLALLSDYLDGDLAGPARSAVEEHLQGCGNCATFGGEVADLLSALRVPAGGLEAGAIHRLQARLAAESAG